ncbi:MAG: alpha/beta fold hydrolase [Deltaproteobacteria bacterium]|nr:alpha/beta fold hydrolase [Deltaproteobacteria bacterium]
MPMLRANGISLYYELHGDGPPLVLLMGLAGNLAMWDPELIAALSRRFRLVLFENRGTGRSDKPDHPYTIKLFADDAAALLAGLGIARAHVLGASMGGMIAQQFALDHRQLVDRLILCCTTAGGGQATPPDVETLMAIANTDGLAPVDHTQRMRGFAFHHSFLTPDNVAYLDRKLIREVEHPTPPFALAHHFHAAIHFDVADRLGEIVQPTLVLVGREDRMVPAPNSLWLAQRIANADLIVYGNAGHGFMTERRAEVVRDITAFLAGE